VGAAAAPGDRRRPRRQAAGDGRRPGKRRDARPAALGSSRAGRAGGSHATAVKEARRERAQARAHTEEGRRLEAEIAGLERALGEARQRLRDPETFRDPAVGAAAGLEHDRLNGALAELYERWSEMSDPKP
jgi:hypothetical protein